MESRNCSISGCNQPVYDGAKGLCEIHLKSQLGSTSARSSLNMSEYSSLTCEVKNYFFSPSNEMRPLVCGFGSEVYFFNCNSVDIPLTEDYRQAFSDLCKIMASKIVKLKPAENEKLKTKFNKFVNACLQIVYNLNVNIDELGSEIDNAYNEFYGKVTDLNIESIISFLNDAQHMFEMKDKARVKLVFTVHLEDEKQKFIQIFMSEPVIDMAIFESKFTDFFSNFITNRTQDISKSLRTFEVVLSQKKKSLKDHYESEIFTILLNYFSKLPYCRVGIFSCKITKEFSIPTNTQLNWEMVSSFFLQKTECSIQTPIEISKSELLIPLHLNSSSFILYYSGLGSPALVQTFRSAVYQLAGGSFVDRVFIYKKNDDKVHEYSLINFKLQLKKSYDTITKGKELVTSIIFIKESERLLYVVDYKQVYIKILNSSVRADLKDDGKDGEVQDLAYYKEKKLVCVKFSSILKLYNIHLQIIGCYDVQGSSIAAVYSLNENGFAICYRDNLIVEVRLNGLQNNVERNSIQVIPNHGIQPCQWSMSKDNINLMKNSSKYIGTVNKKFRIPDSYQEIFAEGSRDSIAPRSIVIEAKGNEEQKSFDVNEGSLKGEAKGLQGGPQENFQVKSNMPLKVPEIPKVPTYATNSLPNPPEIPRIPPNVPQGSFKLPINPPQDPKNIPKIPTNQTQGPPNIPEVPKNLPFIPPKFPEIPKIPQGLPEIPKIPTNLSQGPPNIPQLPPNIPKNLPQGPPNVPNMPQLPSNIPNNLPQGPPNITNMPLLTPNIPKNLPQGPPSISEASSTVLQNPPNFPGMPSLNSYSSQGPLKPPPNNLDIPKPGPIMMKPPQFIPPSNVSQDSKDFQKAPIMPNLVDSNVNQASFITNLPPRIPSLPNLPFNSNSAPMIPRLPPGSSGPVSIPNLPKFEPASLESANPEPLKKAPFAMPPPLFGLPKFSNSSTENPILPNNISFPPPGGFFGPGIKIESSIKGEPENIGSQEFTEVKSNPK